MAADEILLNRVREQLLNQQRVEERKMFRGVCFMVNEKMCVCVSNDELLCRVSQQDYETALEKNGVRAMEKKGTALKGFVFVSNSILSTNAALSYWINLALDFNPLAKVSKKKRQ